MSCPIGRGDLVGKKVHGCKCPDCRAAAATYERRRVRQTAYYGPITLDGDDAERVRMQIDSLQALGWTMGQIADAGGTAGSTLSNVARGAKRPSRTTAQRVQAAWDRLTSRDPGTTRHRHAGRGNKRIAREAA